MHTSKINKVAIATLCNMITSSAKEPEKLPSGKGINLSELRNKENKNYKHIRYSNVEPLPKGMEAHIIALINGALS